jgi:PKHD-type hydroxylase
VLLLRVELMNARVKTRHGDSEELLSLLNMYHNLLRGWTEV